MRKFLIIVALAACFTLMQAILKAPAAVVAMIFLWLLIETILTVSAYMTRLIQRSLFPDSYWWV